MKAKCVMLLLSIALMQVSWAQPPTARLVLGTERVSSHRPVVSRVTASDHNRAKVRIDRRRQPTKVYRGLTRSQHHAKFRQLHAAGWYPVDVTMVMRNGKPYYTARYEKRAGLSGGKNRLGLTGGKRTAGGNGFGGNVWSGSLVTEAVNIELELQFAKSPTSNPGQALSGTWQFTGANGINLGSGKFNGNLAATPFGAGANLQLLQKASGGGWNGMGSLQGGFSANGNQLSGSYVPLSSSGGQFTVTKQP